MGKILKDHLFNLPQCSFESRSVEISEYVCKEQSVGSESGRRLKTPSFYRKDHKFQLEMLKRSEEG